MDGFMMIGRVTKEVELRHTTKGTPVANISLAVERRYKKEGEEKPGANFFQVITWGKLAETVSKYLVKGQLIGVSGHHDTKKFISPSGVNIYTPTLIAEVVKFYTKPLGTAATNIPDDESAIDILGNLLSIPDDDIPF